MDKYAWPSFDAFEEFVRKAFQRYVRDGVQIVERTDTDGGRRLSLRIYTRDHCYSISAREPGAEPDGGYLGCIASARRARPGETWMRGSDLADGQFDFDTWVRILGDIVSYEIEPLAVNRHREVPRDEPAMMPVSDALAYASDMVGNMPPPIPQQDLGKADQSPSWNTSVFMSHDAIHVFDENDTPTRIVRLGA